MYLFLILLPYTNNIVPLSFADSFTTFVYYICFLPNLLLALSSYLILADLLFSMEFHFSARA